jgi:hypothetical protein
MHRFDYFVFRAFRDSVAAACRAFSCLHSPHENERDQKHKVYICTIKRRRTLPIRGLITSIQISKADCERKPTCSGNRSSLS